MTIKSVITSNPGTYALIFSSSVTRNIKVGKLGFFAGILGWYVYVGSGRGPGGLRARVGHHRKITTHPRWHIDYIRPFIRLHEVWYTCSMIHWECNWARCFLSGKGADVLLGGFGASDCNCESHLFYFNTAPSIRSFKKRMRSAHPTHPAIHIEPSMEVS